MMTRQPPEGKPDPDWVAPVIFRVLQDAYASASVAQWRRRAQTFRDAAPKPGDFNGRANSEELVERRRRCLDTAARCERHAALLAEGDPWETYELEVKRLQDAWLDADANAAFDAMLASLPTGERPPEAG